jgi:anaerobic selenocysteine-containing dehydrogenase
MAEWQIISKLALIAAGRGADADPALIDDQAIRRLAAQAGRDPDEVIAELGPRVGPDRIVDFLLRSGPYDLTLDRLLEHPHGIDLGPLEPRLPDVLRTPSGKVELAPEILVGDVARLRAALEERRDPSTLVLIGRRHVRSNNSWMHNVSVLVKGRPRCTLEMHPDDASRAGLVSGGLAQVASRAGVVVAPVEVTDAMMPGVVSMPHGWGHDLPDVRMDVARRHAGVNSNVLSDDAFLDPLSGNAALNGIPVTVAPAQDG